MIRSLTKCLVVACIGLCSLTAAVARAEFPLKDGDVWVMVGDSITAQHLHSNYFEAFCFARYPQKKFAFRNSGVGGHTIPSTLARFEYDIAAWKPTVVSVELGMNDQGGTPTDKFISNMGTMVERIRGVGARPVILSASPINNGQFSKASKMRLDEYATELKEFATKQNIVYADQFHRLVDVWAANKPREVLANNLNSLKQAAGDDSIAGTEHLRAFLKAQQESPSQLISMMGDPVHPGPTGQLMMAAALLAELGADGFVSRATLEPDGKVVDAKGCKIDNVSTDGGKLAFDRLDDCLPFPIPDDARAVVAFDPTILELSQYTLKVTNLKAGNYYLKINGADVATLTSKDLAAGVNLTTLGAGPAPMAAISPIVTQGKAVLAAVAAKENLVSQWRGLSQRAYAPNAAADLKDMLAELTKKVEDADAKIREAAQPKKLHFELSPAQ